MVDFDKITGIVQHNGQSLCQVLRGVQIQGLAIINTQQEADLRGRQGIVFDKFINVADLCSLGTQEFPAGRSVAKEVPNFKDSTAAAACFMDFVQLSIVEDGCGSKGCGTLSGGDGHPRDRGDGWNGLAAKTQGADGLQILIVSDLGGAVSFQAEEYIIFIHALAIVNDPDQSGTAALNLDLDSVSSCIETVLKKLFHNGCWTFDHFACGNAIGELFWEYADF